MADPLSIIASVIAVVEVALETSKGLYDFLESTKTSSDEIRHISRDAHAFYNVVSSLQQELQTRDARRVIAGDEGLTRMVGNLKQPLTSCSTILGRVMVKVQGRVKPDKTGYKLSSFDIKWWFSMKSELQDLNWQLMMAKTTLEVALTSLSTLCNFRLLAIGNPTSHDLENDLNAGFALRRYIDESMYGGSDAPFSPLSIPAESSEFPDNESQSYSQGTLIEQQTSSTYPPRSSAKESWVSEEITATSNIPIDKRSHDTTMAPNTGSTLDDQKSYYRSRDTVVELSAEPASPCSSDGIVPNDILQLSLDKLLHSAIRRDDRWAVKTLLARGADVDVKTEDGETALHIALSLGSQDLALLLLSHGANVDIAIRGQMPLIEAAALGLFNVMSELLERGADVDARDEAGRSALHFTCRKALASCKRAKLLLDKGASATATTNERRTPLHELAANQKQVFAYPAVTLLLSYGATIDAKSSNLDGGMTPLYVAASNSNVHVLQAFIDHGADVNHLSTFNDCPIHRATRAGYTSNVTALLDAGVDINTQDRRTGDTPLHLAAIMGEPEMIRCLLREGAKPQIQNYEHRTPLEVAMLKHGGKSDAVHVFHDHRDGNQQM